MLELVLRTPGNCQRDLTGRNAAPKRYPVLTGINTRK